jgi:hypothetical protein
MIRLHGFGRSGVFAALAISTCAWNAAAQERLEPAGVRLSPVLLADVTAAVVSKQIMLDGDAVDASHIVVQFAGGGALMRDRAGLFQPWDRDPAHLPDNGFAAAGGAMQFKVLDQDLSGVNFPLRVTVYYRANGQMKFGYFDVAQGN